MYFDQLNKWVKADLQDEGVPILIGNPGIGKSSWIKDFANQELGTECFILNIGQLGDKTDMTGVRCVPTGKTDADGNADYTNVAYPHKVIYDAIDYAASHPDETPILFLDEINRTTLDVMNAALSIPTDRAIGSRKLPPNLKVIAAGNDRDGTIDFNKAVINRFAFYWVDPDTAKFMQVNKNLNPYIAVVLKKHPDYIYQEPITAPTGDSDEDDEAFEVEFDTGIEPFASPRSITRLSQKLNHFTLDELCAALNTPTKRNGEESNELQDVIIGACGNTLFSMALLEEIINASSAPTATNSMTLTEPVKYNFLKNSGSRSEMEHRIDELSEDEMSEMFLYCLFDRTDNTNILDILTPKIQKLNANDIGTLVQLYNNKQLDSDNLAVVTEKTNTKIVALLTAMGM